MKNILLIVLCLIGTTLTFAQTVNQTNSEGKKIGFWEVKLDENLIPTESDTYKYIVYNRYDEQGEPNYLYERDINKLFKIKDIVVTKTSELEDSTLLTGTVYVYTDNEDQGFIRLERYKNGHPIYIENRTYDKFSELESTYTFDFLCECRDEGFSYQTTRYGEEYCFYNGDFGWDSYYIETEPEINVDYKYPYFKYTPPLIGLVAGYNFIKNNQFEVGIMLNILATDFTSGAMAGYLLSYSRPLDRNLNTIGLDMGFYTPLTLGLGLNSNFDGQKNHILGFKVFGGVTFYHTSLIYEYNMFKNSKNTVLDLNHHALKLRVTIPLFRIWK